MLTIRRSNERGHADHGWLKSKHTFSFAEYYAPEHMGFGPLRVINEDRIQGGTGFGSHPHKDMEIISYVVSGGLKHEDSMGNSTIIKPGEVQRMSAGSGVVHSEFNDDPNNETHFFQIWITPDKRGGKPGYGQRSFENELKTQKLVHVISREGLDGSISINQDADMYISRLKKGDTLDFKITDSKNVWVQVIKGMISLNGEELQNGDAASITQTKLAKIDAVQDAELLIFEL